MERRHPFASNIQDRAGTAKRALHQDGDTPSMEVHDGSKPIPVVLADDHDMVRAGLRLLLEAGKGFRVIGEARDGCELLEMLSCLQRRSEPPKVVCADLSMPRMDGLAAIVEIRKLHPRVRTLVLTMHDTLEAVRSAVLAGAEGYLVKDAAVQDLEHAVRTLAAGGTFYSNSATRRLLDGEKPASAEELTPRQLEILSLLARGCSSKSTALELGLSPKTIDVHRARIMDRLQIRDIAGLTRYAIRRRLIPA
ncbi:response regulator transcription factor [Ramlibacter sp. AN1133]|uniref:response regulator transcription factor n=1 Tax=Ramlibacter sp. AN1133 TaxID=3133429 RepID=UPI0030BC6E09